MVGKVKIINAGKQDCTQLLLSGSHWRIEELMTEHPVEFLGCGIMLTFFTIAKRGADYKRMKTLIKKGQQ